MSGAVASVNVFGGVARSTQGRSVELEAMGIVDQAVEDGICECRFADSVDFLEDASVNLLILLALGWSLKARARLGSALSLILLIPALGMLWALWSKFAAPSVPAPVPLTITGAGALVVNLGCALALARIRHHAGSISRAAFLSARNDVFANIGIIAAGLITAWTVSIWPDVIVGLAIAAMNLDAAREVWSAAREEHAAAP